MNGIDADDDDVVVDGESAIDVLHSVRPTEQEHK